MFKVNHIFYSLQGEGFHTGRPAAFVRFAGCNLRCPFCDTEFGSYREMTGDDIVQEIRRLTPLGKVLPMVVLTGGEPTLQVNEALIDLLHRESYWVAMESNGTRPAPSNLDWLTVSPKKGSSVWGGEGKTADEIKIVFTSEKEVEQLITSLPISFKENEGLGDILPSSRKGRGRLFLQPCDTGDPVQNEVIKNLCIQYIKQHPQWRLSLQTHKLIGIE